MQAASILILRPVVISIVSKALTVPCQSVSPYEKPDSISKPVLRQRKVLASTHNGTQLAELFRG